MHPALDHDPRHPEVPVGLTTAVYVWQYPVRLFHWWMVISLVVLAFTGYYIHDPFIIDQIKRPYLMGWFRFVHEATGMLFIGLFVMRMFLFFRFSGGNRWVRWDQYVPLRAAQWKEMLNVLEFYAFIRRRTVSKIGHNAMAALSYLVIYTLILVEIVTGLSMYNWIMRTAVLNFFVGWIPRVIDIQNIRLIHFGVMFLFPCFAIFHIHLCMLISRIEKRGLMDSIFIGYKVIPDSELDEAEKQAELIRK
jgi:Ni/Fe-hydrogenase 1 B-type cytochrome subunit